MPPPYVGGGVGSVLKKFREGEYRLSITPISLLDYLKSGTEVDKHQDRLDALAGSLPCKRPRHLLRRTAGRGYNFCAGDGRALLTGLQ